MRVGALAVALLILGLGLTGIAVAAENSPEVQVLLDQIKVRWEKKKNKSRIEDDDGLARLYRAACDLGHAQSCYDVTWNSRPAPADKVELLTRGCTLGGADLCFKAGVGALDTAGYEETGRQLLSKGCERGSISACEALGSALYNGRKLPQDRIQGLALIKRSCEMGLLRACLNFEKIDPATAQHRAELAQAEAQAEAQAHLNARIEARQAELAQAAAALAQAKEGRSRARQIEKLKKKASKALDKDDWQKYRSYQLDICELGDSSTCIGLAKDDGKPTPTRLDYAARACRSDVGYCASASTITRKLGNAQAADAQLRYGCLDRLQRNACRLLADTLREQRQLPSIFDKNTSLLTLLCHATQTDEGITEGCAAYREATATEIAAAEAQKIAEIERKSYRERALPVGAVHHCVVVYTRNLGQWLDQQTGAPDPQAARAAYQTIVERCGGQIYRPELETACAKVADRPQSQRLLCALAEGELKEGFHHAGSGLTISAQELQADFTLTGYLRRTQRGHQGPASGLDGPVRTGLPLQPLDVHPSPMQELISTVSALGDERVAFQFTADGLWVTVPRSAHELGEPLNAIRLVAYSAKTGDPNTNQDGRNGSLTSWPGTRPWHQADRDERAGHWRARTAYHFAVTGQALAELPPDAVLYVDYTAGDQRLFVKPDLVTQQRWVLGLGRFAQQPPQLPSAEVAAAMQAAVERGPLPLEARCGAEPYNWKGSRNDRFTQREARQQQRQYFLDCRQQVLDSEQAALVKLPPVGPARYEHWLRILRERELHRAVYEQAQDVAGLAAEQKLLADDRREARIADRRDARLAAAEAEASKPDKAAEYMAYLDRENARRQRQGLPPLGMSSSGSSASKPKAKPKPKSSREPERASGGGSGAPTVLCRRTDDPDTDTCMTEQERQTARQRQQREKDRLELHEWFQAEQRRCAQENRIGYSCAFSGVPVTEKAEITQLAIENQERSRGLAGKRSGLAGFDLSGVRDCPPYNDDGVRTTSWKKVRETHDEPMCLTRIVGELAGVACLTRAKWACEPDVRMKNPNGQR